MQQINQVIVSYVLTMFRITVQHQKVLKEHTAYAFRVTELHSVDTEFHYPEGGGRNIPPKQLTKPTTKA